MSDLKTIDKKPFEILFGMNSGYVMDFTNSTFGDFFSEHGVDIYSAKYAFNGDSKAKRLRAFWQIESNKIVADILSSLIEYWKQINPAPKENEVVLLRQCETAVSKLREGLLPLPSLESVKELAVVFDAQYLSNQIRRMEQSVESDPALAIGTAKELIETCCNTILTERNKTINGTPNMRMIIKTTLNELSLMPEMVPEQIKGRETIRRLVGNSASVLDGLVELRNLYGTGHGKDAKTQTITPRHAKLAAGLAATLSTFLFETHKGMEGKEQNMEV